MDISVIIINYRTRPLTSACINSLIQFTEGITYEIILVENGSGEFGQGDVENWNGKVKLAISQQNLGFAGGNNLGLKYASGKYVLLLNSDTYVKDNALWQMYQFMEAHPEAGAMSPRLIYPDGRVQGVAQRFPSIRYNLIELFRFQKLMNPRKRGRMLLGAFFDHRETTEADWVWGACMMLPASVLRRFPGGRLDERYFMYWEDVQWCMHVQKLGLKVYFFAGAEIIHIHEGSKAEKNAFMISGKQQFLQHNYSLYQAKAISFLDRLLGK